MRVLEVVKVLHQKDEVHPNVAVPLLTDQLPNSISNPTKIILTVGLWRFWWAKSAQSQRDIFLDLVYRHDYITHHVSRLWFVNFYRHVGRMNGIIGATTPPSLGNRLMTSLDHEFYGSQGVITQTIKCYLNRCFLVNFVHSLLIIWVSIGLIHLITTTESFSRIPVAVICSRITTARIYELLVSVHMFTTKDSLLAKIF